MTGIAEPATLKAGTVLYHGSPAGEFTHAYLAKAGPSPTHYEHPPTPDVPAWFAANLLFSLHAAARFTPADTAATFTLHSYTVGKDLHLMSFQDMDDFRKFMQSRFGVKATYNGNKEAIPLAKEALESNLDGYVVQKDIVRAEPEYVLFASGMAKLHTPEQVRLRLVPNPGGSTPCSDVAFDGAPTKVLATYRYSGGPGELI